jgi:hypothetical protein
MSQQSNRTSDLTTTTTTTTALCSETTHNNDEACTITRPPPTELELILQFRLALQTTLYMLEAARDNLKLLGDRMDRLRDNSRRCRELIHASNDKVILHNEDEQQNLTNILDKQE